MSATGNVRIIAIIGGSAAFLFGASIFLATIGRPPLVTLSQMVLYAFGDTYSLSESLVQGDADPALGARRDPAGPTGPDHGRR